MKLDKNVCKFLFGTAALCSFSMAIYAQNMTNQCDDADVLIAKIEKHGELYYTTDNYVFEDKKLVERLNKASHFLKDKKYQGLISNLNETQGDTQQVISQLADIAGYIHEWTISNCL